MQTQERTQIYIPKKLKADAKNTAKLYGSSFSDFVRIAVKEKLDRHKVTGGDGTKSLLNMALRAKKENTKGSSDLSVNHDYYLYGDGRIE